MATEKKAVVFMADGMEMCECLLTVDILRRAGVNVVTASVMGRKDVLSSHKVYIMADALAEEVDYESADIVILPGGRVGTENLAASRIVGEQCKAFAGSYKNTDANDSFDAYTENGSTTSCESVSFRYVAAICAAPSVLAGLGLLNGKRATCHPDFEERVRSLSTAELTGESVVVDDNIITGQGLGATIDFALCLTEILVDKETASEIAGATCYRHHTV